MSTRPPNDAIDLDQIVQLAKTEREAFAVLYDRYFPLVHRYCQRRALDCATADDLSSEIFLNIARTIRHFPGTTDTDFRRWVYRITTNEIHAHFRKRSRRQALFERAIRRGWWTESAAAQASASGPADADALDQSEKLLQVLVMLSQREQTVLTLRFWESLSYEEVGQIIGARPATVRVIASRAIQTLRDKLVGWRVTGAASTGETSTDETSAGAAPSEGRGS